jgi:glycosyltransferase involved in cell wall biosynthesis
MVTANRPAQARVSIECYLRQSWRNRRMVIVDTGTDDSLERWLQENRDPSINYKRIVKGDKTLGDIRNLAIERARGDYICIWDDDDLHHPLRIEAQMTAIAGSRSTACMLSSLIIWWPFRRRFVVSGGKFWEGTLIARRDTMASFASLNRGEDSHAVRKLRGNGRLVYITAPELYVYVKHLNNTSGNAHFDNMMHSAAAHFSADEHDGFLARLRSVFPIDDYMDAIRL